MWIIYKKRVRRWRCIISTESGDVTVTGYRWGSTVKGEWYFEWIPCEEWVGKRKFQKKPHHSKKVLSEKEQAKKAWREYKRTTKDKAKRQDLHGCHSDGCPMWVKRHCNKKHRQWERRCIHHERYDKLGSWNRKRKDIFDPWMWN